MTRQSSQLEFLLTCDRLKQIQRTTRLHDGSRLENSAEHSWHLAMMALTLAEHAPPGTQLNRVVELLLVHDLVEIYAGHTYFDVPDDAQQEQRCRERAAARTLIGQLPSDQQVPFEELWKEFEAQATPEARFARALDALQPMLLTWGPGGHGCAAHHPELTHARLLALKGPRLEGFPGLWTLARDLLQEAEQTGLLPE